MLTEPPLGIFKVKLEDFEYEWDGYSYGERKCAPVVLYNYNQLIKI